MRKLIVSMNITLDGFMAGPACELDWHFAYWNGEMGDTLTAELYKADCILLGRTTYCGMMQHWNQKMMAALPREDLSFHYTVNSHKKIVCSNTLIKANWHNSEVMKQPTKASLLRLKKKRGKNIIVYGSGGLVRSLTQWKLVDEWQLWLHPVMLGNGKPLFKNPLNEMRMKLVKTKTFATGVVLLCYQS